MTVSAYEKNSLIKLNYFYFSAKNIAQHVEHEHKLMGRTKFDLEKKHHFQKRPTNWWGSANAKRDVTHHTTTVVYNACFHFLRKRSWITVDRDNNTTPAIYVMHIRTVHHSTTPQVPLVADITENPVSPLRPGFPLPSSPATDIDDSIKRKRFRVSLKNYLAHL